jgi:hypothetical protein
MAWWLKLRVTEAERTELLAHLAEKAMRSGDVSENVTSFLRRAIKSKIAEDRRRFVNRAKIVSSKPALSADPSSGVNMEGLNQSFQVSDEDQKANGG